MHAHRMAHPRSRHLPGLPDSAWLEKGSRRQECNEWFGTGLHSVCLCNMQPPRTLPLEYFPPAALPVLPGHQPMAAASISAAAVPWAWVTFDFFAVRVGLVSLPALSGCLGCFHSTSG